MNYIPGVCRGDKFVDVATQRPIRKNQSQATGSSSIIIQETPREIGGNGNDTDSSAPPPPQPKRGQEIAKAQKMPEDPSQKLSIGIWDGKTLPKQVQKEISIILKPNMSDAYIG
ncbi:hypothetical protein SLE2022_236050 [Rubroshorea leprosula]